MNQLEKDKKELKSIYVRLNNSNCECEGVWQTLIKTQSKYGQVHSFTIFLRKEYNKLVETNKKFSKLFDMWQEIVNEGKKYHKLRKIIKSNSGVWYKDE